MAEQNCPKDGAPLFTATVVNEAAASYRQGEPTETAVYDCGTVIRTIPGHAEARVNVETGRPEEVKVPARVDLAQSDQCYRNENTFLKTEVERLAGELKAATEPAVTPAAGAASDATPA